MGKKRAPHPSQKRVAKNTPRADHLEEARIVHRACAIVSAPRPRRGIGKGYFVEATSVGVTTQFPERTLRIDLVTRDASSALPWAGTLHVPARDAWTLLRAIELAFEVGEAAGIVSGKRVTRETAAGGRAS